MSAAIEEREAGRFRLRGISACGRRSTTNEKCGGHRSPTNRKCGGAISPPVWEIVERGGSHVSLQLEGGKPKDFGRGEGGGGNRDAA